jgi:excisionase family DNA binding protein
VNDTLTITEAARFLGVSRHRIRELVRARHLPAQPDLRDRRQKRVPLAALEAFRPGAPRPLPSYVGIAYNPSFQASDTDTYLDVWDPC